MHLRLTDAQFQPLIIVFLIPVADSFIASDILGGTLNYRLTFFFFFPPEKEVLL